MNLIWVRITQQHIENYISTQCNFKFLNIIPFSDIEESICIHNQIYAEEMRLTE